MSDRDAYERFARDHPRKGARMLRWLEELAEKADQPVFAEKIEGLTAGLDGAVRCRECGAPLEDPQSVAAKLGPDCRAKLKRAAA